MRQWKTGSVGLGFLQKGNKQGECSGLQRRRVKNSKAVSLSWGDKYKRSDSELTWIIRTEFQKEFQNVHRLLVRDYNGQKIMKHIFKLQKEGKCQIRILYFNKNIFQKGKKKKKKNFSAKRKYAERILLSQSWTTRNVKEKKVFQTENKYKFRELHTQNEVSNSTYVGIYKCFPFHTSISLKDNRQLKNNNNVLKVYKCISKIYEDKSIKNKGLKWKYIVIKFLHYIWSAIISFQGR